MKKWENADVELLEINETAHGKHHSIHPDEVLVDPNGNYWYGYGSGEDSKPTVTGKGETNY